MKAFFAKLWAKVSSLWKPKSTVKELHDGLLDGSIVLRNGHLPKAKKPDEPGTKVPD